MHANLNEQICLCSTRLHRHLKKKFTPIDHAKFSKRISVFTARCKVKMKQRNFLFYPVIDWYKINSSSNWMDTPSPTHPSFFLSQINEKYIGTLDSFRYSDQCSSLKLRVPDEQSNDKNTINTCLDGGLALLCTVRW